MNTSKAQFTVSYFPFNSDLGLSILNDKIIWVDFKMGMNNFYSNLNVEFSPKWNFVRKEQVNYYFGPGIGLNLASLSPNNDFKNGYFIDFGVRIKPIKKIPSINIIFELSPFLSSDFNNGLIRARLGVSYGFKTKSK